VQQILLAAVVLDFRTCLPTPGVGFLFNPPPRIQAQPSNATKTEAPLRRAASQTTRSKVYPGFIPRDAFSLPHTHHLDEETARIAALAYEAALLPITWAAFLSQKHLILHDLQSNAILQQDLHLRKARRFSSESEASYLLYAFIAFLGCAERQV